MAATIGDLVTEARKVTNPVVTTVSTSRSIAGTSLICTSLSGWPTNTSVHFITYKKTITGAIDKTTQCDWKGIVSSNTIGTLTLKSGTDAGNAIGDFVEMGPTAAYAQDLAEGIEVLHNADGTFKSGVAIPSPALTTPKVITAINDTNGNELFKVTATGSAVNELTVANAATGTGPTLSATGGDTDVDINFAPKGAGKLKGVVNNLFNPYKFSVYRNAALTSANSFTAVAYDTKTFDTGTNVDVVTNKGRFTAPIAGFYWFSAACGNTTATGAMGIALYKDGSAAQVGVFMTSTAASSSGNKATVSGLLQLAANDYVEAYFIGGAGSTVEVGATNCWFNGMLMSAS